MLQYLIQSSILTYVLFAAMCALAQGLDISMSNGYLALNSDGYEFVIMPLCIGIILIIFSCGDDGLWSAIPLKLGNQSIHVFPSLYTTDGLTIPNEGCDESMHINSCGFN